MHLLLPYDRYEKDEHLSKSKVKKVKNMSMSSEISGLFRQSLVGVT